MVDGSGGGGYAIALSAAATVWVSTFSWTMFTEAWAAALVPLLGLAVVVALTGILARRARVPGVVVVLSQVFVSGAFASVMLTGSPVPLGAAWTRLGAAFSAAVETSTGFAAPVPASAPGIHPLLIAGGLGTLLLVDVLACTLRRVPLAGLPLLAVYSAPVSVLGTGTSWWVFVLTATGFLTMLYLDADDRVTRWGRALGRVGGTGATSQDEDPATPPGLDIRTGAARAGAGAVGLAATALAVVVPLGLPGLDLQVFNVGPGDGDGRIEVTNPMVDLRRDLRQGADLPLVRVVTDDPRPGYLRISVLTNFTDNEWTAGDREVPVGQVADGAMPALQGLSPRVPRTTFDYEVTATADFDSTWLPTQAPVSRVVAGGDWRYDRETMDFIAASGDLSTSQSQWSMTAVQPDLSEADLAAARPTRSGDVSAQFLQLPDGVPPLVAALATDLTDGIDSDFEKAVALQRWFRESGGFRYSLERSSVGNGVDELAAFLTDGPGGRVGYCEQFAASMAVMARELGIPSRVAVGFLQPRQIGSDLWEYSAHDLHSWPELFIPGAGWVRFEPTPAARATAVPAYTRTPAAPQAPAPLPTAAPSAAPNPAGPRSEPTRRPELPSAAAPSGAGDGGAPWPALLGSGAGALLLTGLALLPAAIRRRRRERRLHGDQEQRWAELRDSTLDLALPWSDHLSPRQTRDRLRRHLAKPTDDASGPSHREALAALEALTDSVERARYARPGAPSRPEDRDVAAAVADAERVIASLTAGVTARRARAARWASRTVLRPRRTARTASRGEVGSEPGAASSDGTELVEQLH